MYTYMMKLITFMTCVAISCAAASFPNPDYDQFWTTYKVQHGKEYDGQLDAKMRRYVWEKNLRFIIKHNYEADMGQHTFRLGMNEHGDLTDAEYRKFLMGLSEGNMTYSNPTFLAPDSVNLPSEVDWRLKGYVTPVKNQKSCGSCWAFSAVGSLEGQHFRKTGKLVSLSEQNLVDCSTKYGNAGCNGGLAKKAFIYIKENGGIDTEDSYPYTAKDGTCQFSKFNIGATVSGYVGITKGSEEDLQTAVATVGPISVSIDASSSTFRFYKTGVYINNKCSSTSLGHAVLAVGYGEMEGQNYWTVKNSWGASWGQNGYILMARDYGNMCGIATRASYPEV